MIARLESQVLLEDSAHTYRHRTEWNWCNVGPLSRPELESACKDILIHAKITSTMLRGRKSEE